MRTRPLRMRRIMWAVSRGSKTITFLESPPGFAYSLYNFYWATTTIKGRLLSSVTKVKALDCVFFCGWPYDLDLWPFDLEQFLYMAGRMANSTTKFVNPKSIRLWVTSYNVRFPLISMRRITWPVSRGSKIITCLQSPTPICLFTIQLLLGYDDD